MSFLPITLEEMRERHWRTYDFLLVTGDAYVDHPSFGAAVIGRVLESAGYRVALLSQPDWKSAEAFQALGRPGLAALVTGGNIDSMVAHYTAAKKPRSEDAYSPGGQSGRRPDRAATVYAQRVREAFPGLPVVLGGLEASLRRFAHYDYWQDSVRRSVLLDARADLLVYGMGERAILEIAARLRDGEPVSALTNIRGTVYATSSLPENADFQTISCDSYENVRDRKRSYARAAWLQYAEHDAVRGRCVIQPHGDRLVVQNPPAPPLTTAEMDRFGELRYERAPHPSYGALGGVPAIEEVKFSLNHNRGCFGGCRFCSLAFHQGRVISTRSIPSLVREAEKLTAAPDFKGYIHDVGGPTANFRHPSCERQKTHGMCSRNCLTPEPCHQLKVSHTEYLRLLRRLREIPRVKKVFIRSGIRYDYLSYDTDGEFFAELVQYHVSGQLKVAPEHCVSSVLRQMGKPDITVYNRFAERFRRLNQKYGKEQYLVPYLISSHPGCTLQDAVALAEWLHARGHTPQQVQDFYPTPGTLSTAAYHSGLDPETLSPVYVAKSTEEKAMQRALLQFRRPEKAGLVRAALRKAERQDLIGYGKGCLVRPAQKSKTAAQGKQRKHTGRKQGDA